MERPTLKQYAGLSEQDLARHPLWVCTHGVDEQEPWYRETNELTYRPWDGRLPFDRLHPPAPDVAARVNFTIADGTSLTGLLTLPLAPAADDYSPNRLQPILLLPDGTPVGLYVGAQRLAEETMGTLLRQLHKDRSQVFPIRYEVSEQIASPPVTGELAGVYCLRSIRPREIAVL